MSYMNMIGLEMHDAEHFFDIIADDCEEQMTRGQLQALSNSTNCAFCLENVGVSGASPSRPGCILSASFPGYECVTFICFARL